MGQVPVCFKKVGTSDYWEGTFCKVHGQLGINFNTTFIAGFLKDSFSFQNDSCSLLPFRQQPVRQAVCQVFALYFVADCLFVISAIACLFNVDALKLLA